MKRRSVLRESGLEIHNVLLDDLRRLRRCRHDRNRQLASARREPYFGAVKHRWLERDAYLAFSLRKRRGDGNLFYNRLDDLIDDFDGLADSLDYRLRACGLRSGQVPGHIIYRIDRIVYLTQRHRDAGAFFRMQGVFAFALYQFSFAARINLRLFRLLCEAGNPPHPCASACDIPILCRPLLNHNSPRLRACGLRSGQVTGHIICRTDRIVDRIVYLTQRRNAPRKLCFGG